MSQPQSSAARVFQRLQEGKDLVPYFVGLFALLYGAGWAIQYQSLCRLQVGSLTVTREAAIATVLSLIVSAIPGSILAAYLEWAFHNVEGSKIRYWAGVTFLSSFIFAFSAFSVCFLPLIVARIPNDILATIASFYEFQLIFTFLVFIIRTRQNVVAAPYLYGLILLGMFATMFSTFLLPKLPESLGGPGHSKVLVRLHDPDEQIQGILTASDDKALIFTDVTVTLPAGQDRSQIHALRLPVERVIDIRPAP